LFFKRASFLILSSAFFPEKGLSGSFSVVLDRAVPPLYILWLLTGQSAYSVGLIPVVSTLKICSFKFL
jgi:hypothetical protein